MSIRHLISFVLSVFSPLLWAENSQGAAVGLAQSPVSKGTLIETVGGLIIVILLIIALGWGFKKFSSLPFSNKGAISILGGVSLGAREKAVLLQVGKTQLLVGVAPGRVQTLHVLTDPVAVDAVKPADASFNKKLSQVLAKESGES